jgi:glycosyltransferase involved in cell wall biosynthesis
VKKQVRVFQIITRWILGGASKVVLSLLKNLGRDFEQILLIGRKEIDRYMLSEAKNTGCKIIIIKNLQRDINILKDLKALGEITSYIRKHHPQIAHLHTYKAGVIGCLSSRLTGVPVVIFSPHGHIFEKGARIPGVPRSGLPLLFLYLTTKFAQKFAHKIVAVSDSDKDQQIALSLAPQQKYIVINNGIDTDFYSPQNFPDKTKIRTNYNIKQKSFVLVSMGRLTSEKGHTHLLTAMKEIVKKYPDSLLIIIGEGEMLDGLKNQAYELGLMPNVRFTGALNDPRELLNVCDIYIQPSLYESQGLAVIEAMAMGKPIVATNVGGLIDVIEHAKNGFLVNPANPQQIVQSVERLINNQELAIKFGEASRKRAIDVFSVNRMVENYRRLYLTYLKELARRNQK